MCTNQFVISDNAKTAYTHTHLFNGPLSGTTQVSRYQKGKTNLDFTEATDSEWQWYQLGHMQVCTSLQTDNHASTPPLSFLQTGCPSCCPTNSIKALKAQKNAYIKYKTCSYSNGSIRPHHSRRRDRSIIFIVFARWRQCAPIEYLITWAHASSAFCRAHQCVQQTDTHTGTQIHHGTSVTTGCILCYA